MMICEFSLYMMGLFDGNVTLVLQPGFVSSFRSRRFLPWFLHPLMHLQAILKSYHYRNFILRLNYNHFESTVKLSH